MSKQLLPLNIWMVDIVWLFLRWTSECGSVIDGAWSRLYICNIDKCRQSYFWHLLIKKGENISHASVTAANSLSDWRLKQEGVWNACVYERYIAEESLSNFHTHICVADTIHMLQKHVRSAVKMSMAKRIMTEWNTMRTRAMSSWPVLKAENNPNVLVDNQVVTGRTLYKDHFSMYCVLGWMTLTDRRWRHFVTFSMLDLISPCFWGNFTPLVSTLSYINPPCMKELRVLELRGNVFLMLGRRTVRWCMWKRSCPHIQRQSLRWWMLVSSRPCCLFELREWRIWGTCLDLRHFKHYTILQNIWWNSV